MKFYIVLFFTLSTLWLNANNVEICFNKESDKVQFAVTEISKVLKEKANVTVVLSLNDYKKIKSNKLNITLMTKNDQLTSQLIAKLAIKNSDKLKSEGFIIHRNGKNSILVLGADEAGAMYGGLELAEIIKLKGVEAVQTQLQNAYMKVRGTKFNIPLDMRSPTYTEPSDAAQQNMDEMWDFDFWKSFIDNMARNRYNLISLWNLHPFPSMVKVPEYPNVALNDVRRSTGRWKENYSLYGLGFDAPEIMNSYEVLKKMTIDEKIAFWQKVMAYGKQRNVNFYIVTWNVWVYGIDGKYGITDKVDNPITTDYFRKSVKQMLLTYPDLAGIGLTTGENMYDHTPEEKEIWAFETYGKGVLDALKEQPNRKIDFIHRQHETKAADISRVFKEVRNHKNINFLFSFKYAQAHVYSSVKQVGHFEFVKDIASENTKTLWTLRDDDNFYFRWGAPDFVRDFIKNIPTDITEGYYYGSDQYVWGKDFLTKDSSYAKALELDKHWYKWMSWGRLGYNPNMDNNRFVDLIQSRFPTVNAKEMFDAWQNASMIYPLVTGFHWGALDFQWYIEGGKSQSNVANTPSGYNDVNSFIDFKTHKGTDNIAIPEYVKAFLSNTQLVGTTPLQIADKIHKNADDALIWVGKQTSVMTKELRFTVDDITTMAWLGKYYAHKIKAATYVALFRATLTKDWQSKAVEELNQSASYWRQYAALANSNYMNPLWTNRVGYVDFKKNYLETIYEVRANVGKLNQLSMKPTVGGTILEAEDVSPDLADNKMKGFTGQGYAGNKDHEITKAMVWNFEAAEAGSYLLEFRYTVQNNQSNPTPIEINGKYCCDIDFWSTGVAGNWFWERVTVNLKKGINTITLTPKRFVVIDHLNIISNR